MEAMRCAKPHPRVMKIAISYWGEQAHIHGAACRLCEFCRKRQESFLDIMLVWAFQCGSHLAAAYAPIRKPNELTGVH